MPDIILAEEQQKLGKALQLAQQGDVRFAWLHKLAVNAAYARVRGRDPNELILVPAAALAKGFRISERTVRNWIKEGMPVHQYSVGNRPALYDIFDVVRWREKRFETTSEQNPLMRGGASPALERYHTAKASQAERENAEAEKLLVRSAAIKAQLMEIGRAFRTRAELIERTYGREVGNAIREMVDFARAEWEKLCAKGRRKK